MRFSSNNRIARAVLITAAYLLLWHTAAALIGKPLLLPGPIATCRRLIHLFTQRESWTAIGLTLARITLGFGLGVCAGIFLGALTGIFPLADTFLSPLRTVIKATPVTSFILLAILWFSSGMVPVWCCFLMVMPIVWMNVSEGVRSVDNQLIEMARFYQLPFWKTIREIYIPAVMPHFLAAATTALGFAWKAGVAAEILSLPKRSVGQFLYQAKLTVETADLFAWTLCAILLSMLLERILVRLMRRIRV